MESNASFYRKRNGIKYMTIAIFIIAILGLVFYGLAVNGFKYEIIEPSYGYSKYNTGTSHFTNSYTEKEGCIEFVEYGNTQKICGPYHIITHTSNK